ncbi:metal dependent hydrolase [Arcobacter nitrofigilis DSM 7299]|uniref:Metal dependent hydrolase n=1 Tax=Arcobacter nitrofigilis (strain ATCC 33309 / DSM 7299 / CCUG 15893 / LMG 7604 / NCTC 12251 / CI) TaxID=572480 RepID=D5V3E2_ARCNC|nr:MBL fold metallo-hydrolase [Arcobacter nitrofigilis]ADG92724.1 metal dependent hydrolase [Arcobacter nitrofigilis DSM 7299]
MNITVLSENLKCDLKDLKNEHGLSLYIEMDNHHLLFDTGRSDNFIKNAEKLGIPLEKIEYVIISHAHQDHIGGLINFLRINKKAKIYMKKQVFEEYYFSFMGFKKNISVNKNLFLEYSNRICFINSFTEIVKEIYLFPKIDKNAAMPSGNKLLYLKKGSTLVQDSFEHELVMVIKESNGISVFTGCGHSGVVNIVKTVRKVFPNLSMKALIGGFHLISIPIINLMGSKTKIEKIVKIIKEENIQKVYTGHCTGKSAYMKFRYFLGDMVEYLNLGRKINV